MRIGFFGTPHLAARVLEDLLQIPDFEVAFVVTNPDKPVGRNQELKPTPVKELALSRGVPVYLPTKVRENTELFYSLRTWDCDYFVVVAYGRILPNEILDMPREMCINVHGSILPKYRGASPIQSALLNGEKETGVTIMRMSEGMDEGDMISIEKIAIDSSETAGTLFEKFEKVSGKALIDALRGLESGSLKPIPQNHAEATYCTKIEKEHGLVDWSLPAIEIYHKWQAYTPWPGIFTYYEGKRLLLEKVSLLRHPEGNEGSRKEQEQLDSFTLRSSTATENGSQAQNDENKSGTVTKLSSGATGIVCGEGILTLEQVKLEGKKSQSIKDFVNGNQSFISSVL